MNETGEEAELRDSMRKEIGSGCFYIRKDSSKRAVSRGQADIIFVNFVRGDLVNGQTYEGSRWIDLEKLAGYERLANPEQYLNTLDCSTSSRLRQAQFIKSILWNLAYADRNSRKELSKILDSLRQPKFTTQDSREESYRHLRLGCEDYDEG